MENTFQPAHSPSSSQELLSVSSPPSGTLHPGSTPTQFSFSQIPSHSVDGMECPSHWPERHSPRRHWPPDWLVTPDPPPISPSHPPPPPTPGLPGAPPSPPPSAPPPARSARPSPVLRATRPARWPRPQGARLYKYRCAASPAKALSGEARLGVVTSRG